MPFPANKQTFFVLSSSSSSTKWNGRIQCRFSCSPDIFTIQIIGTKRAMPVPNTLNPKFIFVPKLFELHWKIHFHKLTMRLRSQLCIYFKIRSLGCKMSVLSQCGFSPKKGPKLRHTSTHKKVIPFHRMLSYQQPFWEEKPRLRPLIYAACNVGLSCSSSSIVTNSKVPLSDPVSCLDRQMICSAP